jgi:hypothetical protein
MAACGLVVLGTFPVIDATDAAGREDLASFTIATIASPAPTRTIDPCHTRTDCPLQIDGATTIASAERR